jgi:hypothetical protein
MNTQEKTQKWMESAARDLAAWADQVIDDSNEDAELEQRVLLFRCRTAAGQWDYLHRQQAVPQHANNSPWVF